MIYTIDMAAPIREMLAEFDEDLLFLDPSEQFDSCIVGLANRFGNEQCVAYDYAKIIKALKKDGMSTEEAIEYFDYNIIGSWVGDKTPMFINLVRV